MVRSYLAIAGAFAITSCVDAQQPSEPEENLSSQTQEVSCANCGAPIAGLSAEELEAFDVGLDDFAEVEEVDEGLGPVFNERGCGVCHSTPAVGGSSAVLETRFGRVRPDGTFDPLESQGGSLRQDHGIGEDGFCGLPAEITPSNANVEARRRTTPLFGLGLVNAVPDAELIALAALQPSSIRGIPNRLTDLASGETRVGRFGWKAQVATLATFSGDAYINEMGITNPVFPNESCPQGDCSKLAACDTVADPEDDGTALANFETFMSLLAPPRRGAANPITVIGEAVFLGIGCAGCHTPVLFTGPSTTPALANKAFQPFSDFLLHDMGALGDGIVQGNATGKLMRTAPLWGVSAQPSLLHDGRTSSLDQAIRAHDGQGRASRNAFVGLDPLSRSALISFLRSL